MNLTRETIVSRPADLLEAGVGDDLVLLSVEQGSYFALDPIAAVVWKRLAEPVSVGELCRGLQAEYDVTAEQCEHDVRTFLVELDAQHLLRTHQP